MHNHESDHTCVHITRCRRRPTTPLRRIEHHDHPAEPKPPDHRDRDREHPPGRKGEPVARWVLEQASTRVDATFELVDLAEANLPALDEPVPPASGRYSHPHTQEWANTVTRFDGYVFVTPEYNHGYPGSLKNALDRVYAEWGNKAAGFVAYGVDGGVRAVEQLRIVMATLKIADVGPQVSFSMYDDFANFSDFTPREHKQASLTALLDEVIAWSNALRPLRAEKPDATRGER